MTYRGDLLVIIVVLVSIKVHEVFMFTKGLINNYMTNIFSAAESY